jgi:hypothetical protein
MPLREAYEFHGTPRGQVPNHVNGYAAQSSACTVPFDARGAADTIQVPVLIVHTEQALPPDLTRAFYAAADTPRRSSGSSRTAQIDFYADRSSSLRRQMRWRRSSEGADSEPS